MAWGKAGSTTLASTGDTLAVSGMTASKFNQVMSNIILSSNSVAGKYTFNNNTGSNYAYRNSYNGGTDGTGVNQPNSGTVWQTLDSAGEESFQIMYSCSISGQEKLSMFFNIDNDAGAGTSVPNRREGVFKYIQTADISSVELNNTGSGDYAVDTNLSVLGSDITSAAAIPYGLDEPATYEDAFTADNWTTSSSSVIGVSGGVLNWNVPSGSVQEQQSYVDMTGALVNTTKWTLRFKLTVSGFTQGSSTQTQQLFFGISNESSSGHTNTQDFIALKLTLTNTIKTIGVQMKNATPSNTGNTSNVITPLSAGTWYVEINRIDLTNAKITLYSDSSYSSVVSTATETYSANALNDLRYLKCSEYSNNAGTNHTLSGTIDDVKFYNGVTSVSRNNLSQVGSRIEETDTRKIYYKDDVDWKELGVTPTNYRSESWYEQLSGETP